MGIDIWLKVDDDPNDHAYIREGYGRSISATVVLFSEDWEKQPWNEEETPDMRGRGFIIKNSELCERLPSALKACRARYSDCPAEVIRAKTGVLREFVERHKELEEEGKNPRVVISW
jgi:hypothetical protein